MQKLKSALRENLGAAISLLAVMLLSVYECISKCGYHVDEVYTFGLSNSHFAPFINDVFNGNMVDVICTRSDLLDYLTDAPLYETVTAGGRDFLLVHSGIGGFDPARPLSACDPNDLLWHRPAPDERYFDDVLTVLGHTPTDYYGAPGRVFRAPTWIDIDVGAGMGRPPALLRLDDMRVFYGDGTVETCP